MQYFTELLMIEIFATSCLWSISNSCRQNIWSFQLAWLCCFYFGTKTYLITTVWLSRQSFLDFVSSWNIRERLESTGESYDRWSPVPYAVLNTDFWYRQNWLIMTVLKTVLKNLIQFGFNRMLKSLFEITNSQFE